MVARAMRLGLFRPSFSAQTLRLPTSSTTRLTAAVHDGSNERSLHLWMFRGKDFGLTDAFVFNRVYMKSC